MKRTLPIALVVITVLTYIFWTFSQMGKKDLELRKAQSWGSVQRSYYERVGWIRSNPEFKSYRDEVTTFLRWYRGEADKHLDAFNGNTKYDGYLKELEKRTDKADEGQMERRKVLYEYVKETFEEMGKGAYNPVFTGTDKGIRLDIASAEVKSVGGKRKIVLDMVLWGAPRSVHDDVRGTQKMVVSASFSFNWKLWDEGNKLMGEVNAAGDPNDRVDHPERYIPEFPPQIVLGRYELDLVPAAAKVSEMIFGVSGASPTGGRIASQFTWKQETPPEWKLAAGAAWEGAEESVRPETEIDPSKAPKR